MVRILTIVESGTFDTSLVGILQNNGFDVEVIAPTRFWEQGYDSYVILLCELEAVRHPEMAEYLHKWNGPALYISRQEELPMTAKSSVAETHVARAMARELYKQAKGRAFARPSLCKLL